MPQQAVRFPDDLHSAIKAEADRRGKPHTFSSVLIEWATMGGAVQATRPNQRALEAVLSEASRGSSGAPLPAKGVGDTASVSSTVIPTAQPRTHGKRSGVVSQAFEDLDGAV